VVVLPESYHDCSRVAPKKLISIHRKGGDKSKRTFRLLY
jgi:hypothetical protein